ncbi:alpha-ketoacid dehydrogenase subunit beta [Yimella sp. cx-51]|uniref:alpha-ketoacid dehydrogenase subunit beta n=1 Tax=Yimella sp. cx-51 TaxID=2770551 RepID=UPI00165DFF81|nr:alpha-ketoacid dehydrogenase subunit beta [Yimella sp. cx-51]MBC9955636.1 alpha-ketoacid dehydrogenase subunit beta [Yimella sp. cx-51]QTH37792.1 alpha-ketoacid dehydrogenase subunit beta [Yimella sp. cx-51]
MTTLEAPAATQTLTFSKAINQALRDAMAHDDNVLMFGEDVGVLGGVFRVTDGLTKEFGEERCFDTPLAESGIVGFAIGLCYTGFRPVVEMQFDAFAYPAFEQIASHVAKMHNRTNGSVSLPMVIRVPYAGGIGGVEHHCDSSEGYYAHTPGLKVYTPATPEDAYWMLRAAIDDPDPVVFMEPKVAYWNKADVDTSAPGQPVGEAAVRRPGKDVTLITYGPSLAISLKAAAAAAEEGWDVEVIDLRSIVPLDDRTVMESVRHTGRCIVVSEAQEFAGVAGELAARITEQCFHSLAAPVLRVSGLPLPYPAPMLEHTYLPGVDRILDAIERLQWDDEPDLTHHGVQS